MTQEENNQDQELDKIDSDIKLHRRLVIQLIVLVIIIYVCINVRDIKITDDLTKWGTFGDFFGGILNPIFALFAFYWLTYSVRLQVKELKETRKELSEATNAQRDSANHQERIAELENENVETQKKILELQEKTLNSQNLANKRQQQQISIQNFESLFFQLLKAKTELAEDIYFIKNDIVFRGKEAVKNGVNSYKEEPIYVNWEEFYENYLLDYMGSYFRVCYQIVKLIDNSDDLKSEKSNINSKKKEYFDIFRATLTQYELEAFFFNCLCGYGEGKFKKLLEKYGLFEHIIVDKDLFSDKVRNKISRFLYLYSRESFEKNKNIEDYFLEINRIKFGLTYEKINEIITKLRSVDFVYKVSPDYYRDVDGNYTEFPFYAIDKRLKWSTGENIFTEDNIEYLLYNSQKHKESFLNVKAAKEKIEYNRKLIGDINKYFEDNNENLISSKRVSFGTMQDTSIDDLENVIQKIEDTVVVDKISVGSFYERIIELKECEYTETVLIIIKYNIDYFKYCEYKNTDREREST